MRRQMSIVRHGIAKNYNIFCQGKRYFVLIMSQSVFLSNFYASRAAFSYARQTKKSPFPIIWLTFVKSDYQKTTMTFSNHG